MGREWWRNNAGSAELGTTPAAPPATVNREFRRGDGERPNRNWDGQARRDDAYRNHGTWQERRVARDGVGRDDIGRNDAWRNQQRGVDNRWNNNGYRPDRHWDGNRNWNGNRDWNDNRGWNGNRSWSRDWRRDQRYDWQRYRYANRSLYRARPYYAPYGWSYGYRRFSIGFSLSNILFDQRYWINDPYAYRLPQAYEPYRWVRYYDDVLLVDLRSGQVVDVIHDFFW